MPTVLPRRLAPNLLGGGNIAYGVAGLLDSQRTIGYAHVIGPLKAWAVAFLLLGLVILAAATNAKALAAVSVIAVFIWLAWATFTVEAHISDPHVVTLKGPALLSWIAALHFLLSPYNRKISLSGGSGDNGEPTL